MNMHTAPTVISPSGWLQSREGTAFLQKRAAAACLTFLEEGLAERLGGELSALLVPGSRDFRLGGSLWKLSADLSVICLAARLGMAAADEIWNSANQNFLPVLQRVDEINFQGRANTPKWNSDLSTAEIGASLALAVHFASDKQLDRAGFEAVARKKCLEPILADWLRHDTRLHALDTMGHNWWSVIVGGAGIMAVALGDAALADEFPDHLRGWFHYAGNELARKCPSFGQDGDFVESFHYADYGLYHPIAFSRMHPAFKLVPDALNERQIRGLARWLGNSILPVQDGYPQQRFGDIQFYDGFLGIVWQTVAKLAGDAELMEIAHRIRPEPRHLLEMLFWEPPPPAAETAETPVSSLQVFSNSGMAFMREDDLRLTVRAGEFWGHNHLDAGSFVFHQQGVTWIDDSGACDYGRPDYTRYYVSAEAHNVAYAPTLAPPSGQTAYEGMPATARYLLHSEENGLKVLCADTGILSGSALSRSYRWFFGLDSDAVLVWDDLASYREETFVFRLHSATGVDTGAHCAPVLISGNERCPLEFYSDAECRLNIVPAMMGQLSGKGQKPVRDLEGHAVTWETGAARRVKFGLVLSARPHHTDWLNPASGGVECRVVFETTTWRIWFNPKADGRVMHENALAAWNDLETDAYALILREEKEQTWIGMVAGSFLRRRHSTILGSLVKQPLTGADIPLAP